MKRLILFLAAALVLCSCANKSMTRYEALAPTLKKEGFEGAIQKVKKEERDLYGDNSQFLYHFDLGTLYHYNSDFKQSAQYLDKAEEIYDDLYTKSVTNEAAAIVTNDNVRPYRARPFEIVVLHELQILNYLGMGDIDGAMVEVKRAQLALERLYQKDNEKVNDNGFLRYLCALVYELDGEADDAAIAYEQAVKAYDEGKVNMPKEVWEYVNESLKRTDREDNLKKFKHDALAETPKAKKSRELGQEIIVIGYAGHSPILGELYMSGTFVSGGAVHLNYKDPQTGKLSSITLVAPTVAGGNGETFHIGFSLPQKKTLDQTVGGFDINIDGTNIAPEKYMDVEEELDQNLKDDFNSTILRTAVRVTLRTIAAQQAKKAMKTGNALLNLVTSIGTDVAQSQLEQADLRVGLFMPHSIYMSRTPVEAGIHNVTVRTSGKNGGKNGEYTFKDVKVPRGKNVFLIIPAIK